MMKSEYPNFEAAEADKDAVKAFFKAEIDAAVERLPEDLRQYITGDFWHVQLRSVGSGWSSRRAAYSLYVRYNHRNAWGETKFKILKSGKISRTRLDEALLGLAHRIRGRETSANVKADNIAAWENAGEPGGKNVTHTSSPDRYQLTLDDDKYRLRYRYDYISLIDIAPTVARFEKAVAIMKGEET